MTDSQQVYISAAVGGLFLTLVNLWEERTLDASERQTKDWLYWLFVIAWPAAAVFLVWAYTKSGSKFTPIAALSVGVTAPTTVQAMIAKATTREKPQGKVEE